MRMLVDSQRESATTKLQKLISSHRGGGQTSAAAAATTADLESVSATTVATPATVAPTSNLTSISTNSIAPLLPANANISTPQIHPDLSITSVAGALPLTAALSSAPIPAAATTVHTKKATGPTTDNSVHHLQAEILKLRRTVARLGGVTPR